MLAAWGSRMGVSLIAIQNKCVTVFGVGIGLLCKLAGKPIRAAVVIGALTQREEDKCSRSAMLQCCRCQCNNNINDI